MVSKFPRYRKEVSLVPGGPLQFLDLAFNPDAVRKLTAEFYEYFDRDADEHRLIALREDEETGVYEDRATRREAMDPISGRKIRGSSYTLKASDAIEPFLDKWVPLPVFRADDIDPDGEPRFSSGPTDWARARISKLDKPDRDGRTHAMVVAFDPFYEEEGADFDPPPDSDQAQLTLSGDVEGNAVYTLAYDVNFHSWWLFRPWVGDWIKELWLAHLRRTTRGPLREEDLPNKVEHLARYIMLLDMIHALDLLPRIRLVNPTRNAPIDVDLVLDIGNSRTCGMLIERGGSHAPDMRDSTVLEIRDMSRPERRYRDPLSSNLAFSRASFANAGNSAEEPLIDSGRTRSAFDWPTIVRVGPEAMMLAARSRREEGQTSMSSPKRYLWDRAERPIEWRFCPSSDNPLARERAVTSGAFTQLINDYGTPLRAIEQGLFARDPVMRDQEPDPTFHPKFSRSSLMMLLLAEVLLHALVQIEPPRDCRRPFGLS